MAWGECSEVEQRKRNGVANSSEAKKRKIGKLVRASGIAPWDVPTGMATKCKNFVFHVNAHWCISTMEGLLQSQLEYVCLG